MTAVPRVMRQLDDFAGAAAAARRKPVPDRDQDVAMGDRRAAGHHISVELASAGRREARARRPRSLEQRVEPLARAVVGEARAIVARARTAGPPAVPSRARARLPPRSGRRRRRSARRNAAPSAHPRSTVGTGGQAGRPPPRSGAGPCGRAPAASSRLPAGNMSARWPVTPTHSVNGGRGGSRTTSPAGGSALFLVCFRRGLMKRHPSYSPNSFAWARATSAQWPCR